jgi:zinc/manganese transport system substrate-binding protein
MFSRLVLLAALCSSFTVSAHAKVLVAASTNDLASIAASVGGDAIEVFAIARPSSDPHRIEALPSYMVKVSRAKVYLKVGLGLDQWADAIVDGSRNARIQMVDCSAGVRVLEKPSGKVDASMGDVHPDGNPHYWMDPRNGGPVARNIAEALGKADPANAARFKAAAEAFAKDADACHARNLERAKAIPSFMELFRRRVRVHGGEHRRAGAGDPTHGAASAGVGRSGQGTEGRYPSAGTLFLA